MWRRGARSSGGASFVRSCPSNSTRAAGRLDQSQDEASATVDFPDPLSPTSPSVSPARKIERDAVDGPYVTGDPAQERAVDRERLPEVGNREQWLGVAAAGRTGIGRQASLQFT